MLREFVQAGLNSDSFKASRAYEQFVHEREETCTCRVIGTCLKLLLNPEYYPDTSDESTGSIESIEESLTIKSSDFVLQIYPKYVVGFLTHRPDYKIHIRHGHESSIVPRIEPHVNGGVRIFWPNRSVEINQNSIITDMYWYNSAGELHRDGHLPAHSSNRSKSKSKSTGSLMYYTNGEEYLRIHCI